MHTLILPQINGNYVGCVIVIIDQIDVKINKFLGINLNFYNNSINI